MRIGEQHSFLLFTKNMVYVSFFYTYWMRKLLFSLFYVIVFFLTRA